MTRVQTDFLRRCKASRGSFVEGTFGVETPAVKCADVKSNIGSIAEHLAVHLGWLAGRENNYVLAIWQSRQNLKRMGVAVDHTLPFVFGLHWAPNLNANPAAKVLAPPHNARRDHRDGCYRFLVVVLCAAVATDFIEEVRHGACHRLVSASLARGMTTFVTRARGSLHE
ncbi:hypothetical protein EJ04DRAFT_524432 [Polyplosphaeria fusca]|uniref:Uncharacterized protein n=1 Tax=Polyplosphaeria fusca TaxID=682080 RepID=A0A9P4QXU4_9PLEO|nr:hypothetical protein EJ04DRAFT_524432 [Polyplosphaeria fusca]